MPSLFAVLVLPYAFTFGVTSLLIPYLLRKNGTPLDQIANIVVVANFPLIWSFLWSPLADVGWQRRWWVVFSALGAGSAGCAAILSMGGSKLLLTALLFLMNAFGGLLSSTCGALLTEMPVALRGRSAGWYQAGNTAGAAISGAAGIWLSDHAQLEVLSLAILAAMTLPALAVLAIRDTAPQKVALDPRLKALMSDLRGIFQTRRAWIGLAFILSPVGSAALMNLISGMAPDYGASGSQVVWMTGIGTGLLAAVGSFFGGIVADRIGRLFAYVFAGILAAVFGFYLGLGGKTPLTYAAGYSGYAIAAGFVYAVFTAVVLDVVGPRKHAAASGYAVLTSAGNLPIAYMTWLDGLGYRHWGARGTMLVDAAANGGAAVLLLLFALAVRRYWNPPDAAGS